VIKFLKKWFFPKTFTWVFYTSFIIMWFVAIPEWNRTWGTFQNSLINMVVIFYPFYVGMDGEDGRFTNFHDWLEVQNIWMKSLFMGIMIIIYFTLIALVHKYFPVIA